MRRVEILNVTLAMALSLSACSEWIQPQSVDLKKKSFCEETGYEGYVAALNDYKSGYHRLTILEIDNPSGRKATAKYERLSALPDSVDAVVLLNPDNVDEYCDEIAAVRKLGTKVLYEIPDCQDETNAEELSEMLGLYDKYNYDGIVLRYTAPSPFGLTSGELESLLEKEDLFWNEISNWQNKHPQAVLMFKGKPQYLLNPSLLSIMKCIIIDCTDAVSIEELRKDILLALPENGKYPDNSFVIEVCAPTPSLFVENGYDERGYFCNVKDGLRITAVEGAALCVLEMFEYGYGVMVRDAQYDYFHQGNDYRNVRRAITLLNPAFKF